VVTRSDHHRRHSKHLHFALKFLPKADVVVSVVPDGEAHVYDVVCADPHRNFVANGIIVHNCGKTWTSLAAAVQAQKYPVLVVCQTQVLRQWQRVIGSLFPTPEGISPSSLGSTRWARSVERGKLLAPILRTKTPSPLANTPFAIIHYGLLTSWKDALLERHFPTVIFDEVQELRRRESAKYTAASLLSSEADQVWGVSGSPVYNYGSEIWNVLNAIDFHCLGSYDAFTRDWCTAYGGTIVAQPAVLGDYLKREGLLLRRRTSEVLPELPPVHRRVQTVDHDEGLHAQLIGEAVTKASKFNECGWHERGQVARDIDRLSRYAAGLSKVPYVAAFVAGLIEAGERPLLFGWHHDFYTELEKYLGKYEPAFITGRETEAQKDAALQRFLEGQTPLAILSLRTAAGLDGLQYRATCVVMGELDWSPAVHSQLEARVARLGVPKEIEYVPSFYCISETGYDQVMLDVLGLKTEQFTGILLDEPETYEEKQKQELSVAQRIMTLIEKLSGKKVIREMASREAADLTEKLGEENS
jgi:SNF2 family DNA or RNA helicase